MCVCVFVSVCESVFVIVCVSVCVSVYLWREEVVRIELLGFRMWVCECCAQAAAFYFCTFIMMEVWYNSDLIWTQ